MEPGAVKALLFDVFGTVVDWRGTIIAEGRRLNREKGLVIDWAAFADTWRAGYAPAMQRVRTGELPWQNLDALHRLILNDLVVQFQLTGWSEPEIGQLNRVWHRLKPWPDAQRGLHQLRRRYLIAPLSNGNVALLTNMAKQARLPWDCILSAELFGHYKPDREVYLGAVTLLGLHPHEVMMVAAHNGDLQAAQAVGLRTAFVPRPQEHGRQQQTDLVAAEGVDLVATDFIELAEKLACAMWKKAL